MPVVTLEISSLTSFTGVSGVVKWDKKVWANSAIEAWGHHAVVRPGPASILFGFKFP